MISIIICSRNKKITLLLSNNINDTIGNIDYEIVWIDNSSNQYSIFEAYNLGVEKSKGEYLCFMHEDILFHSNNWGGVIVNIFKDHTIGMIGVIGGYYISKYSTDWYSSRITKGKIIQGHSNIRSYKSKIFDANNYDYGPYVAAIDGLWMCIPKRLFTENLILWDDNTYKGFHLYDFDMCMQINSQDYKIQIADNILIEHKSAGNPNRTFFENCILFHEKWNSQLPFTSSSLIRKKDIENYEINILKNICTYTLLYKKQNQILNQPLHKLVSKITLLWYKWIK